MAPRTPSLWDTAAKKEALELIAKLWVAGSPGARKILLQRILQGPPEHLPINFESEEDRTESRDRRVFERLMTLKRVPDAGEDSDLVSALQLIQDRYPSWKLPEGDKASFSVWTEMRYGPETQYSSDDLQRMSDDDIAKLLMEEEQYREGLMDLWRRFAAAEPPRAILILRKLAKRRGGRRADIWWSGLWGMRDHARDQAHRNSLMALLQVTPRAVLAHSDVTRAVADILELLVNQANVREPAYWALFDRALEVAEQDPENAGAPANYNWVELAINRSLGRLATAFFDALYNYKLKVADGIPVDQSDRLARVIGGRRADHRIARVIAASRLPYLFAVDPAWSARNLIPLFDWRDETEAMAVWQGFAWAPRVSPDLWLALKPYFMDAFKSPRLENLGNGAKTLAQLLVMVGVEFPSEAPSADHTRSALRAMSPELRDDALWWLWTYIAQEENPDDSPRGARADTLWKERIGPWIARCWPREKGLLSAGMSERFALIVVATADAFPEAVDFVEPFLVRGGETLLLSQLGESKHPDRHPASALKLMDRCIAIEQLWGGEELARILERIRVASPELADDPVFRGLYDKLRQRS